MRRYLEILFTAAVLLSPPLYAVLPPGAEAFFQQCSRGHLFPYFKFAPRMTEAGLRWAFDQQGKFLGRLILQGAPTAQPKYFYRILPTAVFDGAKVTVPKAGTNEFGPAIGQLLLSEHHAILAETLVDDVLSKKVPLPMVYKPNDGQNGTGVLVLTEDPKGGIHLITWRDRPNRLPNYTLSAFFARKNISPSFTNDGNLTEATIPPEHVREFLTQIFEQGHQSKDPAYPTFGGMAESFESTWLYNGLAYDVRYAVTADLAKGTISDIQPDSGRIGENPWFTNQRAVQNRVRSKTLAGETMFDPVYEKGLVDRERKTEFETYARQKAIDVVKYFAEQWREEGFILSGESRFEIDFMWIPAKEATDFPTPFMPEIHWAWGRRLPALLQWKYQ